jgi:protein-tyrosine-phosphatase
MPPRKALTAGSRHGIDISTHRSALATQQSLRESDLVVVMSSDQARNVEGHVRADTNRVLVLGDLDPHPVQRRTIPDPWGSSDTAFDASYDRIHRCVRELAGIIGNSD